MNKELKVINQFGYELSTEEFESLKKNHPYIGEKLILDLVNGIGVVAKDLNDTSKSKEKGFSRLTDSLFGNSKKRQNQINKNVIEGLNATSEWLQDHDRHLGRVDERIKDIANELYDTQDQIIGFYEHFKGVESIVKSLEVFREVANKRFDEIEERLSKVEAQQHVDREVEKIGTLNLPTSVEVFTVLDNLVSRKAGLYYMMEEDAHTKDEFLTYIKNKIKSKIGSNHLQNLVDYQKLHNELKVLEVTEQKAIAFLGSQYSSFSDDSLYEVSDIVKIVSNSESIESMEKELGEDSHISTFLTVDMLVDEATDELMNI